MKKLLVIGNKEEEPLYMDNVIPMDVYLDWIDKMDYICRINRMQNYGITTGKRIDGLYIGAWPDFVEQYDGGEHKDLIKDVPQIFMVKPAWDLYFKNHYAKYITENQKDNIIWCNFNYGRIRMDFKYPCSVISMIDFFAFNEPWCSDYEIWFTGIDVTNRDEILLNGWQWADTNHKVGGKPEREFLEKLINKNKIKWLEQEIWKTLQ